MRCNYKTAMVTCKSAALMWPAAKGIGKGLWWTGKKLLSPLTHAKSPIRSRLYSKLMRGGAEKSGWLSSAITDMFMVPLTVKGLSTVATAPISLGRGMLKKTYGTGKIPMTGLFTR